MTLFSFSLSDVVCFGVGAGANVLTELAVSDFLLNKTTMIYMYLLINKLYFSWACQGCPYNLN